MMILRGECRCDDPSQIIRVFSPGADGRNGRGCDFTAKDIFWDGVES
jgi:hypothetical protein